MQSYAQVLGWQKLAVAPSLQIFVEGNRLLFNAGENVQRFHLEHKLHLTRTSDVFLTSVSAATTAGLPGLLLTVEGAGNAERSQGRLRLWGTPDLPALLDAASRSFAGLHHLEYEYRIPPAGQAVEPIRETSGCDASSVRSFASPASDGCDSVEVGCVNPCPTGTSDNSQNSDESHPRFTSSSSSLDASECLEGVVAANVKVKAFLLPHSLSGKRPLWAPDNSPSRKALRVQNAGEDEAEERRSESTGRTQGSAPKTWGNPLLGEEAGAQAGGGQILGEDTLKKKNLGERENAASETTEKDAEETDRKKKRLASPNKATVSAPASPTGEETAREKTRTEKEEEDSRGLWAWQGERRDTACDCVAYLLTWPQIPGKFFPDKAKALKVPVGPLFGRLKNGESIEIPGEGRIVTPEQVCGPGTPGQTVLVIECVETQQAVHALNRIKVDLDRLTFVFHMTPPSVLRSAEYSRFVQAVTGPMTRHVVVNQSGAAVEVSPFVHASKLRRFLHDLIPPVFPFPSSPVGYPSSTFPSDRPRFPAPAASSVSSRSSARPATFSSPTPEKPLSDAWGVEAACVLHPNSLVKFDLSTLEKRGVDSSGSLTVFGPQFSSERLTRLTALEPTRARCREILATLQEPPEGASSSSPTDAASANSSEPSSPSPCSFSWSLPSLTLLGTGAAAPSQYRNVAGILLAIRADLSLVLDFGEGSLAQLYSTCHSWQEFLDVISSIRIVFISHCHADHHLGVCTLLEFRAAMFPHLLPPVLLAPAKLQAWLSFYDRRITRIPHRFRCSESLVDLPQAHGETAENEERSASSFGSVSQLLDVPASDVQLRATPVSHIPHSFGLRVDFKIPSLHGNSHEDFSVVYSGDTRPCQQLFDLARNATVLIHEATFEDALIQEAIEKRHSSLSEVVRAALACRCNNLVLTHFSQRYPKIPVLTLEAGGDAFLGSDDSVEGNGEVPDGEIGVEETRCKTKAPVTVFSKQKREGGKDPMHILFAFDCMRLPLKHLQELSQCLEMLPGVINQLFVSD
ncbi:Ribonuclease Z, related [Neospora caninum Liverpool]|uniref:ribonuclease Z n=1 Tax=Neospora caninum (strain Liverpool) TaxID=572307 RepID=F0VKI9_NEOCL|nr:Ribonuclease Z, related [Neospora caninum Liverpool]CBZ54590.1 Ribonuclease Z, related [Neospora caninum Liverpool]CEL69304.1 TPA: Ribonuclease Z, related [Neospora caninum Liverpool]|eukprot:XP_003884620.1 Ribonuclease Z, related [Neospora caninum Liverpool]